MKTIDKAIQELVKAHADLMNAQQICEFDKDTSDAGAAKNLLAAEIEVQRLGQSLERLILECKSNNNVPPEIRKAALFLMERNRAQNEYNKIIIAYAEKLVNRP